VSVYTISISAHFRFHLCSVSVVQTHVHGDARSTQTTEQNDYQFDAGRTTREFEVTRGIPEPHPPWLKLSSERFTAERELQGRCFNGSRVSWFISSDPFASSF